MSIFREIPPTAGFPITLKNILSVFSPRGLRGSLEEDFKNYLSIPYAAIVYSGTTALYIILEAAKELSPKKTVIIPAFICPLVPLAIRRAGLKVEVCDINRENFNFDLEQLEGICSKNNDILAIVAVHLAGIALDFAAIQDIAAKYNIFIIEDCAQALGAEYSGKKVGTLADFSFFSLCRGKGLTIYEGGVIVANKKEYAGILDRKIKQYIKGDLIAEAVKIIELFGYWLVYRPPLFWFAFSLPQVFWNLSGQRLKASGDYYTVDFPMHKISWLRKAIGHVTFGYLENHIAGQRRNAGIYISGLISVAGIKIIREPNTGKATYPYLTILFSDQLKREKAQDAFRWRGLGVSQIYEAEITGYEYLKGIVPDTTCANARYLAQREITLSTSVYLKEKELYAITEILAKL